jgi:hypothetical protein
VRKAALIVGLVFALITACSPILLMAHFPGYGLLRVAGTGFFCLIALPLQLIYNLGRNRTGLRRTADVVGLLGMWFLLLGLLFMVQSWPGGYVVLLGGIVVIALFGTLFIAASRQNAVTTEWFNGFTTASLVIIIALGTSLGMSSTNSVDVNGQTILYEAQVEELKTNKEKILALINVTDTSIVLDSTDRQRALDVYEGAMDAINDIEAIKKQLVIECNREVAGEEASDKILNPDEINFTTWFMVGEDVTDPDGKGILVYSNLREFRKNVLPGSVEFSIAENGSDIAKDQWVKDNFYHATVMEALTRLTNAQVSIQESVITTLETKAYIE